jgi:hypothetical protein
LPIRRRDQQGPSLLTASATGGNASSVQYDRGAASMSAASDNKHEILQAVSFGQRIAEDEVDDLASYFVETDQWKRIFSGAVDIVYGPKGSGKSAIYSLLMTRTDALFDRGIIVAAAENPRGTPAFRDLVTDPPASEAEFVALWKLYLLCLIAQSFRDYGITGRDADALIGPLVEAQLIEREKGRTLQALLRGVQDYARRLLNAEAVEGGFTLDPSTGMPSGITGKITLREPTAREGDLGLVSVDTLLGHANAALGEADMSLWLVLDRLDVAFAESEELEKNALRALFKVYLDLASHDLLSLKIFLRTDIWKRITMEGFREASHITRHVTITWDPQSLLNLAVRRIINNPALRKYYSVDDPSSLLANVDGQRNFLYRLVPDQVEVGSNKPETFVWILSRTRDASGVNAPRELIHFLSSLRDEQLRMLEIGHTPPSGELLFDRAAFKSALPAVSKVRLEQTVYAEYPSLRAELEGLEREKTQQYPATLARIWGVDEPEALSIANQLVEIGFFERRGSKEEPAFWVPFLYRDALSMVQGSADPGRASDESTDHPEDEEIKGAEALF